MQLASRKKAVSKLDGVESCSVSLLTNSMGVEGTASDADIIAAVEAAGYGASKKGGGQHCKNKGMRYRKMKICFQIKRLPFSKSDLQHHWYF